MMLMFLLAVGCEDGCTAETRCEKRGGRFHKENCHQEVYTYTVMTSFDGGSTYIPMQQTGVQTVCDEWCEGGDR